MLLDLLLWVQRANHWSMELDSVTFKQWWFTNFDVSYFSFPSNQLIWVDKAHTRFLVFYDHYRIVSIVDLFSCQDNSNIHFPYKLRERELKEIAEGFNYIKKCHIWSLYSFCGSSGFFNLKVMCRKCQIVFLFFEIICSKHNFNMN